MILLLYRESVVERIRRQKVLMSRFQGVAAVVDDGYQIFFFFISLNLSMLVRRGDFVPFTLVYLDFIQAYCIFRFCSIFQIAHMGTHAESSLDIIVFGKRGRSQTVPKARFQLPLQVREVEGHDRTKELSFVLQLSSPELILIDCYDSTHNRYKLLINLTTTLLTLHRPRETVVLEYH